MTSVCMLSFWVIHRRLNSEAGELPRRKHTTFRTRRKFEIKIDLCLLWICYTRCGEVCWLCFQGIFREI